MRVLLTVDGSQGADTATALVGNLKWSPGTEFEVLSVVETSALVPMPMAPFPGDMQPLINAVSDARRACAQSAAARLRAQGLTASSSVITGRPADAIVERAAETGADLVVCGSRGRGSIRSFLLGSVSAELVQRVSCPVLIARRDRITRIVLAHDGSDPAREVEDFLAECPAFQGMPVTIASAVLEAAVLGIDPSVMLLQDVTDSYEATRSAAEEAMVAAQSGAKDRLVAAGIPVRTLIKHGWAPEVILDAVADEGADLIAIGTHARHGLERLLMGSVARNVLFHSPVSVLTASTKPPALAKP